VVAARRQICFVGQDTISARKTLELLLFAGRLLSALLGRGWGFALRMRNSLMLEQLLGEHLDGLGTFWRSQFAGRTLSLDRDHIFELQSHDEIERRVV
jgi:hypothetical protein